MSVVVLPVRQRPPWWRQLLRRVRYGSRSGAVVRLRVHQHTGRQVRLREGKR